MPMRMIRTRDDKMMMMMGRDDAAGHDGSGQGTVVVAVTVVGVMKSYSRPDDIADLDAGAGGCDEVTLPRQMILLPW